MMTGGHINSISLVLPQLLDLMISCRTIQVILNGREAYKNFILLSLLILAIKICKYVSNIFNFGN